MYSNHFAGTISERERRLHLLFLFPILVISHIAFFYKYFQDKTKRQHFVKKLFHYKTIYVIISKTKCREIYKHCIGG